MNGCERLCPRLGGHVVPRRVARIARPLNLLAAGAVASGLALTPAAALTITDTFDTSITGSSNAAAIESAITAASGQIAALYSDPITVQILFGTSSGVGGGQSSTTIYSGPTSDYLSLLSSDAATHPANTTLATAVNHFGSGNTGATTFLSSANLRALGVNKPGTVSGTFDGAVTLNSNLSIATNAAVIQHEIDEVLGGGGAGTILGQSPPPANLGSLDIYRYSAPGVPSLTASTTATSYLSVDGGVTSIASFNQSGSGDYGDFTTTPCFIQSWEVCGTLETYSKTSPEFAMMEAIGYDPYATPLPSTWVLMLSGLAGFAFLAHRRTRTENATASAAA